MQALGHVLVFALGAAAGPPQFGSSPPAVVVVTTDRVTVVAVQRAFRKPRHVFLWKPRQSVGVSLRLLGPLNQIVIFDRSSQEAEIRLNTGIRARDARDVVSTIKQAHPDDPSFSRATGALAGSDRKHAQVEQVAAKAIDGSPPFRNS